MCGTRSPPLSSRDDLAADQAEARVSPPSSVERVEQQLHAEADAEQRRARGDALGDQRVEAELRADSRIARGKAPTPGQDERVGGPRSLA